MNAVIVGLLAIASIVQPPAAESPSKEITGRVLLNSKPVAGAAVRIAHRSSSYEAGTRMRFEPITERIFRTDATGRFSLQVPADTVMMQIVANAAGASGAEAIYSRDQPGKVEIKLQAANDPNAKAEKDRQVFAFTVVRPDGSAVKDTVIRIVKAEDESGGRASYGLPCPPGDIFVTDDLGRVHLTIPEGGVPGFPGKIDRMWVRCFADGWSDGPIRIGADAESDKLELRAPATIAGRVLRNGEPVKDAGVLIDWSGGLGIRSEDSPAIKTDEQGRFRVPAWPGVKLTALVLSSQAGGIAGSDPVDIGPLKPSENADIGDLVILPSTRLAGTVVVEKAPRLPRSTVVSATNQRTGQTTIVPIDKDGRFEFKHLAPGGPYDIALDGPSSIMRSHMLSPLNKSVSHSPSLRITGMLRGDIENLTLLVIKFDPNPPPVQRSIYDQPFTNFDAAKDPIDG